MSTGQRSAQSLPEQRKNNRRARGALAGVAAVALLLAGGRWASYLGFPGKPIFLTDALLVLAFLHAIISRLLLGPRITNSATRVRIGVLPAIFVLWIAVRFLLGQHYGLSALRDLAPYGYIVVAFLSAKSFAVSNAENRRRTFTILRTALIFHFFWVGLSTIFPSLSTHLPLLTGPTGATQVFRVRPDFDAPIVGTLAGLCIVRFMRQRRAIWAALVFLACWALILEMHSRAGLIGTIFSNLVVLAGCVVSADTTPLRKALVLLASPLVLLLLIATVPHTTSGARLLSNFAPQAVPASEAAEGTTRAREETWVQVWNYTTESPARALVGVGFGPDFMADSGALQTLRHHPKTSMSTRSPHNYLVGSFARLGTVGILLLGGILVRLGAAVVRALRHIPDSPVLLISTLIVVGIFWTAVFGVVLESPFGAVPFFWSAGILLHHRPHDRAPSPNGGDPTHKIMTSSGKGD